MLAIPFHLCYPSMAVTLIAMKHRLPFTGFMWSEGHVAKTGDKSLYKQHLILSISCGRVYDTHGRVYSHRLSISFIKIEKEAAFFMANQVMRITLKAYDHQLVDSCAARIVDTVKKTGAAVSGPVPLPTKKEVVTILRAVHKYKDSREQFEQRTHKRLIDVIAPSQKTVDALSRLEMPAGVNIDIKMKSR